MNNTGKLGGFQMIALTFLIGIVGFVIGVVLLQSLLSQSTVSCSSNSFTYNISTGKCNLATNASNTQGATFGGNVTANGLGFARNFSSQWGLAGTILGYVLVLAILALIGLGGYAGWQKFRGGR